MSAETKARRSVNITCVNFNSVWGDTAATLQKMLKDIREAAAQGADLVVFPEGALQGAGSCEGCREAGGPCAKHLNMAELIPGPSTNAVAELCREHDLYVVFGMPELDPHDPGVMYNAAAVVGPEGPMGSYRKVHLGSLPWVTEGITYTCGTELPIFETRFGPFGVQICYDFWFNPELTRILALKGAQLIVCPVGSFAAPGRADSMRATALSRAQENLLYVAISNLAGGPGDHSNYSGEGLTTATRPSLYTGHSMIAGPAFPRFGQIMAEGGATEELVSATISMDRLERFDAVFNWREWRRTNLAGASALVAREFDKLSPVSVDI